MLINVISYILIKPSEERAESLTLFSLCETNIDSNYIRDSIGEPYTTAILHMLMIDSIDFKNWIL